MRDGHTGKSTAFLGVSLYSLTIWLAFFSLPFFVLACDSQKKESYAPVYASMPTGKRAVLNFGVLPFHNPQRLYETFGPLVEYLSRKLPGITFTLEASRSYEEFEKKLDSRHFAFALPNPYQTINSLQHGYHVFAKMGEDDKFRGLIIVRKDSGIKTVADLKGKIVSFPAPTGLAATMMPLYYLHTHGLDVNQDIKRLFSGSLESSIMNVYLGKSAAGGTWLPAWQTFVERNPLIAAELEVKWETPSLLNNGLVARDDVPPEMVDKVQSLLLALPTHEEGRRLLAALPLARFESATDVTYQPVRDFMKRYSEAVH
ncbi:MAG: phosphate/phosphite/phosphonate ABC transporter substrate-binding protein [Deltaproteobacteria bacterium]|nr:phosphate/phosphite/phosphonate ABC transporter substrate-binding protein [Deltaproteobacteria bacterium]